MQLEARERAQDMSHRCFRRRVIWKQEQSKFKLKLRRDCVIRMSRICLVSLWSAPQSFAGREHRTAHAEGASFSSRLLFSGNVNPFSDSRYCWTKFLLFLSYKSLNYRRLVSPMKLLDYSASRSSTGGHRQNCR
jgi:hypothetical protein